MGSPDGSVVSDPDGASDCGFYTRDGKIFVGILDTSMGLLPVVPLVLFF